MVRDHAQGQSENIDGESFEVVSDTERNRVSTLLGYVNNLDGLYYAADLNVFISTREGLGGLDGVAHGLYIIRNGCTGMKDYIKEPETGLLLKKLEDKKKLAEMITAVKANKRTVQSQKID